MAQRPGSPEQAALPLGIRPPLGGGLVPGPASGAARAGASLERSCQGPSSQAPATSLIRDEPLFGSTQPRCV
eukprot:4882569-Pyramimonas_sp.AAC.1